MRKLLLSGAVLLGGVIALSACHPVQGRHDRGWMIGGHHFWSRHDDTPVKVAATLNCPEQQGELTRVSMAADSRSCQYRGDQRDVTLSLIAVNNQTPQAALAPMEKELRGLVPAHAGPSAFNVEAKAGPNDEDDNAKIDLPGLHIDAHGDTAKVKVLGAEINANGDKADIRTDMGMKGTVIHAGPGGAEITAGEVGRHSAQLIFILAGDNPGPTGYRAVGYVARGPASGPLVVGEFKSKVERHDHHDRDLEKLIDLNVTPAE